MGTISVRSGTQGAAHPTSEASSRVGGTTEVYAHPLGTPGFDDQGNEYVYCEYGEAVYAGVWVGITADYKAVSVLTTTFRGPVGIVAGSTTSDTAGWVQVRGTHSAAQMAGGDSAATSSYNLVVASSVSTPAAGANAINEGGPGTSDENQFIYNAWVTGAASSATTSATSTVGVSQPVRLNYPHVTGYIEAGQTS